MPDMLARGACRLRKVDGRHTSAMKYNDGHGLACSFLFSRGKPDRSDTTRSFPTFAYQLAASLPAVQPVTQRALAEFSSIPVPYQSLADQIEKLIVDPLSTAAEPVSPMIAVIDGLDECSDLLLLELIQLLVDTANNQFPLWILLLSRPEAHIQQTFGSLSIQRMIYVVSLRDFDAHGDIRTLLQSRLSEICEREMDLMRDMPRPWPSHNQLEVLVDKSEGLFIYVSTLLRFLRTETVFCSRSC